jgi:hypothetical protein
MKQVCPFQEADKTEAKMLAETFDSLGLPLNAEYLTAFCSTAAVVPTVLQFYDPVFCSGAFLLALHGGNIGLRHSKHEALIFMVWQ